MNKPLNHIELCHRFAVAFTISKAILRRVFSVLCFVFISNLNNAQVVINEVGIAPTGGTDGNGGEFIELFNKTGCDVDIGCYVVVFSGTSGGASANPTGWTVIIPQGTKLASCSYFLIGGLGKNKPGSITWNTLLIGGTAWVNAYGTNGKDVADLDLSTSNNTTLNSIFAGGLQNTQGGQITLLNSSGTVVSSVAYGLGNNPLSYLGFLTNPPGGCTAVSPVPTPPDAGIVPFNSTSNDGIYLDASGNYQPENSLTPGVSNSMNGGSQIGCDAPIVITTATSNEPLCSGGVLNLMASASGPGSLSYNWTSTTGFSSFLQNPTITNISPSNSGSYTVTVSDANGCSESETVKVTVYGKPGTPPITHN